MFAAQAIWVQTALRLFSVPVLTWFPQHTSPLIMWCFYVSSLILVMYSSPFPLHTFHLSTTGMHIRSSCCCCCCFFATRGKAVHWRNQNSWIAWVQAFQLTALSPFIQLITQSTVSQGPFWTATDIALLGLLDLGFCAGLKRQKNVRHFVHWKPIILCALKSNNFLHKFPIISSSSAANVNTFHKSCIWTPQNSYF